MNLPEKESGFTLVEMLIASAIMIVVVFGGYKAFEYFNKQTSKEAKKMDDISEFNALTKDLLQFTEGAGISTFYLNLPIKTSDCNATEPCVRELVNNAFVAPTQGLPSSLTSNSCVQFYRDARGKVESKLAYPGNPKKDLIWNNKDLELALTQELYATWILKDQTSPPFMMMKSRDATVFLKMLVKNKFQMSPNALEDHGLEHAFFASDAPKEAITKLTGYPFLIYNSYYSGQYIIQYAEEVISCEDSDSVCRNHLSKLYPPYASMNPTLLSAEAQAQYPSKIYAIKFKEMDFNHPFFKNIFDRQGLPSECLAQWGQGAQPTTGSFFPSRVINVTKDPEETWDVFGPQPQKIAYLNKYSFDRGIQHGGPGTWVALPIDIITYKAETNPSTTKTELVSEMWHLTETKRKTKIHNLTSPFTITRKLGSPEMGIWYNPIKKAAP